MLEKLKKLEKYIPWVLLLIVVIDISLTMEQISTMHELGTIPSILQPIFKIIFSVVLPIKRYSWFIIYNLVVLYFSFYSYFNGQKHNKIFIPLIWSSVTLTYFSNMIVRPNEFHWFWDYYSIFYFPLFLVSLSAFEVFFKKNKEKIKEEVKYIKISTIYIGIIFAIAFISQTQVLSYGNSYLKGISGWFHSSNSIGHLLTLTFPILLYYLYKSPKSKSLWVASIISVYSQLSVGTKTPFFGLIATFSIFFGMIILIELIRKKQILKTIIIILLGSTILLSAYNIMPIKNNLEHRGIANYETFFEVRRQLLEQTIDKTVNNNEEGVNQTVKTTSLLLLGNSDNEKKLVEKDYHDILFNNGLFGLVVFLYTIVFYLLSSVVNILKNIKHHISVKTAMHLASVILILGIAQFSGHIFRGSYVVIYSAYLIILLYLRSEEKFE